MVRGFTFHQFCQLFLRETARHTFTAHIGTENSERGHFGTAFSHAPLGRGLLLHNTAQWGVICEMFKPAKTQ